MHSKTPKIATFSSWRNDSYAWPNCVGMRTGLFGTIRRLPDIVSRFHGRIRPQCHMILQYLANLITGLLAIGVCAAAPLTLSTRSDSYNFGQINQGSTSPIKHGFILKNNNAAPITVDRIAVSCGCTTAVPGGGVSLPDVLAPGKEIEVDTSIDPLRLFPGAVEKSVSVYIAGQAQPAAVLEITGTLAPAASFSPDMLNVGDVAYGDGASLNLTATIDKAMVPSLDVVKFETTDPDITADKVSAAPFGANEEAVVYNVELSKAPYITPILNLTNQLRRL